MSAPAVSFRVLRNPAGSVVVRPRVLVTAGVLAALAAVLGVLSIGLGDLVLAPGVVLDVLAGGGTDLERLVVLELRLPRAVAGMLVGLALGLSGAITQSLARNPLASPDVLGITAGAGAGAVTMIVVGGAAAVGSAFAVPLAALGGAVLAAVVVGLLAWNRGVDPQRLVLVGIGVGALATAVTSWLLTQARLPDAAQAMAWLTGSLAGRGWAEIVPLAVGLLLALVALAAVAAALDVARFDGDTSRALGIRPVVGVGALVAVAVVLAALATAAAGPVAFVALAAPQIARRIVASDAPPLLVSALVGAALLTACDLVARVLLPVELPVGVVTAVVGAPYLLVLILTAARKARA